MSTPDRTDADLIAATLAGDAAAYGALVRRHQRAAVRIAAIALGGSDGADDVAQDAFVKIHRSLDRFRPGSPFEPWMYRIVTNTARNRLRGRARQGRLALRVATVEQPTGTAAAVDPMVAVEAADERRTLVDAINRLRPEDRLILTYRWFDELGEAEIAAALGCRRGTVKSRLSRAMARLRTELLGVDPGDRAVPVTEARERGRTS